MKLTNLMVMSLDGEIASRPYENSIQRLQIGLTNQDDQDLVQREIQSSDAVIVGANTVRAEGSIAEIKNAQGSYPTWFICTNKGFDSSLAFWKQKEIPRVLFSQNPLKTAEKDVQSLCYGENPPATFLKKELQKRGFRRVLLLGGGLVNSLFYSEGCVDELKLAIAPLLLSKNVSRICDGFLENTVHFDLLNCEAKGDFLFLHYKVRHNL